MRIGRVGVDSSNLERFHRRARAEQIPVSMNIIDPANSWPEFVFARPRRRERRLFACVRPLPIVGSDLARSVRRVFQHVVCAIHVAISDLLYLRVNRDHSVAKAV